MDDSDVDDWDEPLCFNEPRHLEPIKGAERVDHSWRVKEKYKTHCVALVLCLNVGVDPPDVVKTQPCARLECWIDPYSLSPSKALESIGHALQAQYERWQPRARYKQSLDPTSDEVKKLCCSLRRNAKEERVLFHYNGHGVPRPTAQGEIWVFNRAYTQYIPLSMYDLQAWLGAPSLYVYDCSNAGVIVDNFHKFADQHERDHENAVRSAGGAGEAGGAAGGAGAPAPVSYRNCIQLAACAAGQSLPMSPELPADLFTACLTTPVTMAMKWFVLRARTSVAPAHTLHDLIDKIPGQVTDRRTMLGELNWIFTAVTDTIAWSSLPPELFQQLFRADLLTASLCRNYLLADRIMRSYNCTPVSAPALPSLAAHPLWAAWEYALDLALAQLPALLATPPTAPPTTAPAAYQHSPFFRDQLTAFTVWLDLGSGRRAPPQQLPMVLQVLLSTLHRVRALRILCRFLALGAWAVRAVLRVGIFPYMLKLLQASAPDLRASMVFIWAKIIAHDPSCQVDLVNAKGHKYFLAILQDPTVDIEHRTMAAYVLAGIVDNYPAGQEAALQGSMISICLEQLQAAGSAGGAGGGGGGEAALRQWACVALGRVWRAFDAARWSGVRDLAHEKLYPLLAHGAPEVRAACAFALGTFMGAGAGGGARSDHAHVLQQQVAAQLAAAAARDASPLVRAEILAALQWPVLIFEQHFMAVYFQERMRRSDRWGRGARDVEAGEEALPPRRAPPAARSPHRALALPAIGFGSVHARLWGALAGLAREPHPQVAQMAADIIAYIANLVDNAAGEAGADAPAHNTLPARRKAATLPHTASEEMLPQSPAAAQAHPPRARADSERDSTSSTASNPPPKKAIVRTEFVEWAWAQFGESAGAAGVAGGAGGAAGGGDVHSRAHLERAWRRARNRSLRRHALGLREARIPRLEAQLFHSRCALPPSVLLFHPYEQHIAVANKDNFGIWDWGTAAKLCVGGWRRAWGRISALAYLNAHERALLAAASHSGHLAIYRPAGSSTEPALVGAWRALEVRQPAEYRPPPAQPIYSLAQLVSEQFAGAADAPPARAPRAGAAALPDPLGGGAGGGGVAAGGAGGGAGAYTPPPPATLLKWAPRRHSLALAGHAPHVRLWDARSELLVRDIPTESEAAVTALWRGGEAECSAVGEAGEAGEAGDALVAGFADGAVRGWDERCGGAPALQLHAHHAPVLCAARRPDLHTLVTGCMDGVVHMWDTRRLGGGGGAGGAGATPALSLRAPPPLAAVACHPLANLLACGSVNQCISIYELKGGALNTIRFHEGFMGARIGPVSTLTFHPLRCALGVGSKDSSVSVYAAERR